MVNIKKLIKVSSYAKKINKSVTWVRELIKKGEIEDVIIDGVVFIKLED